MNLTLTAVLKMTELLEAAGKEQEWDNEGLVDGFSTVREFRKLKDLTVNVANILRKSAIPSAAFGVKLPPRFSAISPRVSYSISLVSLFLWFMMKPRWTSRSWA